MATKSYASPKKVYCQTTLFCNQKCAHCCYDSGPEHKEFMSMDVFEAALKCEPQGLFNMGGGEPTCHPLFWDFLDVAIKYRGKGKVWLATNGKLAHHAMLLAGMVQRGEIRAVISDDQWHEPVRQDVMDLWRALGNQGKMKSIRTVSHPIKTGRCDWGDRVTCNGCGMPFIQWDGNVRQCACLDAPVVGNVFEGYRAMFEGDEAWKCWKGLPDPDSR